MPFVEKRLSPRERGEPEAIARLRSEAALLEALGGRVTPILLARGEDERGPWHRTARIPYPTLAERLERANAPLDSYFIERAARLALATLAQLHEARDGLGHLAVVHADLSPANVAIDDRAERMTILDFDLAWWRDAPSRDGAFRGTIAYVAPEIARGDRPTPQSDLFALAASFFHAMIGQPPRRGPSLGALLAVAAEEPVLRSEHRALFARGGGHAALLACLEHEVEARPRSAREALSRI